VLIPITNIPLHYSFKDCSDFRVCVCVCVCVCVSKKPMATERSRSSVYASLHNRRMYRKVPGQAASSDNSKWYSSLPLAAVVSLFCESV
jgi:hypothetical protein